MDFAEENVTPKLIQEIQPLIEKHYEELGKFKEFKLDPDYNAYYHAGDFVKIFTAREQGNLVGYSIFWVSQSLHHQKVKQALQDILFLDPKFRGQNIGIEFVGWCDERLKEKGVQVIMQVVRNRQKHGAICEALGYEPLEWVYARRIQ